MQILIKCRARENLMTGVSNGMKMVCGSVQSMLQQSKNVNSLPAYNNVQKYLDNVPHAGTQLAYTSHHALGSKHALHVMGIALVNMASVAESHICSGLQQ